MAEYLISRMRDRATGRSAAECVRNYPRDIYFIGSLRPAGAHDEDNLEGRGLAELRNKLAPVAFGAEFLSRLGNHGIEVVVSLRWACYYRVWPSLEDQRTHLGKANLAEGQLPSPAQQPATVPAALVQEETLAESNEPPTQGEDQDAIGESERPEVGGTQADRIRARRPKDSLFIRFRKIHCHASGRIEVLRPHDGEWQADCNNLQASLDMEVARARDIVLADRLRIRTATTPEAQVQVPDTDLVSAEAYDRFINSLSTDVLPEWHWGVGTSLGLPGDNTAERVLSIEFVNMSPMPDNLPNTEAFFFDCEAEFAFEGDQVQPFELELPQTEFRYDRFVWGHGINCALERRPSQPPAHRFITNHAPVYRQRRFVTRVDPPATFAGLAHDPMPVLDSVLNAMREYVGVWTRENSRYSEADPTWAQNYAEQFHHDRRRFEDDIERFQQGCEIIQTNHDARLAFRMTNETFRRGTKTQWRLFQLVFLVAQLPGIVSLADGREADSTEREHVDIIYFPTGGGKTEAYLATIVFHCFFDRLRGKTAGITAWTRFPLRLLTLQQTQRVMNIVGIAELVRREQSDPRLSGPDVDGFAVGYFVGEGGSPNAIVNPAQDRYASPEDQVTWSKATDPDARQDWKRVALCPGCGTATIQVQFRPEEMRLVHQCTNADCPFPSGTIPLYIVDNEIYRYLPAVIVGTIDKLAGLGNQRKFALLCGEVDGRCIDHGYYKGKCCQSDCRDMRKLNREPPRGVTGPTLFVQDELHLLKEGLGTFDGHYETFLQRLLQEFGQTQPLKIIASSATIEAFDRQVNHLYGRREGQARVFPGPGPSLEESFYARTQDHPQRLFVGILPHNKTIFNAILELIDTYHREVQLLRAIPPQGDNPYGGVLVPGTSEWVGLLDPYTTSVTYFLSNRELNSIATDIDGDVIPGMTADGLPPVDVSHLTGSTPTDDVFRVLAKLEEPAPPHAPPDAVLATSMISHGVDIDRLNTMIFYGMPRLTAEYIQASSRVGRSHVGIVITCLHPVRERDQSHYAHFVKFHEFLGRLIEPVAINRWSKFSITRTLPGLFMGVLLQLIANRSGEANPNRYYMIDFVRGKLSDGSLRPDHFTTILEEAYGVSTPATLLQASFRDEIHLRVRQYIDWLQTPSTTERFVSEVLLPKPLRSLRDVDDTVPIELDSVGSEWAGRRTRT